MKGFLLSAFIVISFIVYALMQKFGLQLPFLPSQTASTNNGSLLQPLLQFSGQLFSKYKDGEYIGDSINTQYGDVQVKAIIIDGRITNVEFLNYPQSRTTSQKINANAMPVLISETIAAQDSNVDAVTGATFTSEAFEKSLQSALNKAVKS